MYFITGLQKLETDNLGWLDYGDSRVFGYYSDLEIAKERVVQNACDIFECVYMYMLIEEIGEGLYSDCRNRWLYKFNLKTKEYKSIEEPECIKNTCNFSVG
jgi:hypothetical protein